MIFISINIFPQCVIQGSEVAISINLPVEDENIMLNYLKVNVVNPDGNAVTIYEDNILICKSSDNNIWISYKIPSNSPLGYYRVAVDLINQGQMSYVDSCFIKVEKLNIIYHDNNISKEVMIQNLSNLNTEYDVYISDAENKVKVIKDNVEGNITKSFIYSTNEQIFIKYADINILNIIDLNDKTPYRNPVVDWRYENENLISILMENSNVIFLKGTLLKIWNTIDGIHSINYINKRLQEITINEFEKGLNILASKNLIKLN